MKINVKLIININFLMNARIFVQGLFLFIFSHAILILLNECYVMALYFLNFSFIFTNAGFWIPIVLGICFAVVLGLGLGIMYRKKNKDIENQYILVVAILMLLIAILLYFVFSDKIYYAKEYIRWGDLSLIGNYVNTKKTDLIYFLSEKIFSLEITLGVMLMYICFFIGYRKFFFKSFESQEESEIIDIKIRTY